ncbi:MAG TPA: pyridoxamine 5'-phosphate oxidase, partial [Porticoccaceae bacterium]|nr:pyridoxamine 5'-phosphate oxidase [Porticoccaceae bacterium]
DQRGFVFYTNLNSHKARDIASNPQVSLHFPWFFLDRQVAVSGIAEQVSRDEVDNYFATRPRDSQLAAWASDQSAPLASRAELETRFERFDDQFIDREIPAPDFWGGFRIKPVEFQFWQGGPRRLHDRFRYLPAGGGSDDWKITRLAP